MSTPYTELIGRDRDKVLLLHHAQWNPYIVHSSTNALFIKLGKV
jgi:hypothetical protein